MDSGFSGLVRGVVQVVTQATGPEWLAGLTQVLLMQAVASATSSTTVSGG
jgi:hypothetical protein